MSQHGSGWRNSLSVQLAAWLGMGATILLLGDCANAPFVCNRMVRRLRAWPHCGGCCPCA